jgi:RHS repeat-associated protein
LGDKRLTEANYSNGDYYHYAYDAVGNRETQQKSILGLVTNDTYVYDDANRLTSLNGLSYTWDNNGNLLNDSVNTYTYDSANRLKSMSNQSSVSSFGYNGLGDRLQQTVNGNPTTFTMDLNAGLTQALSDGTNTYIYGNGRIAQAVGTVTEYFLGDALGSVRQLTNAGGTITYAKVYDPYGVVSSTSGSSQSAYGYTNEYTSQGLTYLRARYYASDTGRFLTRDTWEGDPNSPLSLNRWNYVESNPINYVDPSGRWLWPGYRHRWHAAVGDWYMGVSVFRKQLEFRIPKVNVNNSKYWLKVDMFNSLTGDTWEIEPVNLANTPGHGVDQTIQYRDELNIAAKHRLLDGYFAGVFHYDWNNVKFRLGKRADWPGRLIQPLQGFPMAEFVADYQQPGLIVFWIRPSAIGAALVLAGAKLVYDRQWQSLLRPRDWRPRRAPAFDSPIPDPIPFPNPILIPVSLSNASVVDLCLPQLSNIEILEINLDA